MPSGVSPDLRFVWPAKALDAISREPVQQTALVLMVESADDFKKHFILSGLASRLLRSGVKVFALVGKESELAHDALDWSLVDADLEDVLTTWHDENDMEDVATFVVENARANGLSRIIAVMNDSIKPGIILKQHIVSALLSMP